LKLKKSYKERETYLMILKQALNKALSLIKNQVFNSLNNLANSITIHLQETKESLTLSADNAYTLFYGKFRSNSHRIKALMEQLEQRTDKNIIEYDQALVECHKYYVHQRRMLLLGSIHNAINDLGMKYQRDTCTLVRSSCSFMINLCLDEYKLFTQFFTKPSYLLKFVF
jgi:conserved oligomeric Golgi complex subunit 3